jgi:hypothetical protein
MGRKNKIATLAGRYFKLADFEASFHPQRSQLKMTIGLSRASAHRMRQTRLVAASAMKARFLTPARFQRAYPGFYLRGKL